MWKRELMKNKLYAIGIVIIGALSVLIDRDATFFIFTLVCGLTLFFAKENWIVQEVVSMGRAEMRRAAKNEKKAKTATYNLTKAQMDAVIRKQIAEELGKAKQEAADEAVNTAMVLLLTLPLEVLMDHYWKKSYARRIPEFTNHVLEYYKMWQDGELDMDKLKEDLWEYGGVRLEVEN